MPKQSHGPIDVLQLATLIVEHATDYAVFTIDRDGVVTGWSSGAEKVIGYTSDEVVGTSFARLFSEPDVAAGAPQQEIQRALLTGRAEDTRWHLRKSGERFWANGLSIRVETPEFSGLMKILRDETPARLAEEQRVLLLHELNHRIKNTLATVQAVTEQTLRAHSVDPGVRRDLTNRLMALSQAHDILVRENWAGADLETIVRDALGPYGHPGLHAFQIEGPAVRLSPQQAVAMSLALHELTTNAVKHGALSVAAGRVKVAWNEAHDGAGNRRLTFLWKEFAGPPVEAPRRQGFGSRLIARSFGQDTDGSASLHYDPDGVRFVAQVPLSTAEAQAILDLEKAIG